MSTKACATGASVFALGALALLLLASCASGPRYSTRYSMELPQTDRGRGCVVDCQRNQNICEGNVRAAQQNCKADARRRLHDCTKTAQSDYQGCLGQMQPYWSEATKNNVRGNCANARDSQVGRCNSDYSYTRCDTGRDCDAAYRQCFQVCGGTVRAERVCVSNCGQAR